jgi:hypothetical protein
MNPSDPEQEQFDKEMANATAVAELEKSRAEAQNKKADALLKSVRAASEKISIEQGQGGGLSPEVLGEAKISMLTENQKHIHAKEVLNIEFMDAIGLMREQNKLDIKQDAAAPKALPKPSPANRTAA